LNPHPLSHFNIKVWQQKSFPRVAVSLAHDMGIKCGIIWAISTLHTDFTALEAKLREESEWNQNISAISWCT